MKVQTLQYGIILETLLVTSCLLHALFAAPWKGCTLCGHHTCCFPCLEHPSCLTSTCSSFTNRKYPHLHKAFLACCSTAGHIPTHCDRRKFCHKLLQKLLLFSPTILSTPHRSVPYSTHFYSARARNKSAMMYIYKTQHSVLWHKPVRIYAAVATIIINHFLKEWQRVESVLDSQNQKHSHSQSKWNSKCFENSSVHITEDHLWYGLHITGVCYLQH